ncbi:prephenate dehydrogenase/arogenate dehydrogenase family protein [Paenibacillus sp. BR2-3]|uniref:prephenate dehydrogenase dimerization domain-containing protein n=1 Tax=Paenibacillus sp. BR2-3 TaxID=3048494 RepID=UPI0039776772
MSQKLRRCVIVGGAGGVGGMFATLLARSGVEVCVIDMTPPAVELQFEQCDITAPTKKASAAIKTADMVVLALPESVALRAVAFVGTAMKPEALLAHTLSVQSPIAADVRALGLPLEVIGLNPMFAPSLSIVGRPVAVIIQNDGPRTGELLRLLSDWGGRVVRLGAEEHDQLVAAMQALTHAAVLSFGLALAGLNVDIAKLSSLAPPPHATLLALLARISSGTPEVYWDVQSANHRAPAARAALAGAIERLNAAAKDESAFIDMLREAREVLGTELAPYQELCARIFNGPLSQLSRTAQEEKQ